MNADQALTLCVKNFRIFYNPGSIGTLDIHIKWEET